MSFSDFFRSSNPSHYPEERPDSGVDRRSVTVAGGSKGVRGFSGKPPGFKVVRHQPKEVETKLWMGSGTVA